MPEQKQSDVIRINARPEPISIDVTRTAVIVVDMQNDFGSKGGMFDRAGIDISMIQGTVDPTAKVLASARQMGLKIIYLKMGFRPELTDLGAFDAPNRTRHMLFGVGQKLSAPDGTEGRILIRDTWNTDILAELKPEPEDIVIYKHRFSGFYETELDDVLKKSAVKYLIVTGCTTSVCVESTVRDASSGIILACCWQTAWANQSERIFRGATTTPPSSLCRSCSAGYQPRMIF